MFVPSLSRQFDRVSEFKNGVKRRFPHRPDVRECAICLVSAHWPHNPELMHDAATKRSFLEFSLGLSRACLDRIIIFTYKWRFKRPFCYLYMRPRLSSTIVSFTLPSTCPAHNCISHSLISFLTTMVLQLFL